jgi:cytochrome c oxidase subunit 3
VPSIPYHGRMRVVAESDRERVLPNGVLGMLIFLLTEIMLFAGLISAFMIIRSQAIVWPPPGQPRLPIEETAFNTAALLASGLALYFARRVFRRNPVDALRPLGLAIALGLFFVVFQGFEWAALLGQGLTMQTSSLGSFFYLIVGMHALHAIGAIGLLVHVFLRLRNGWLSSGLLATSEVLWYFVVGIWPVLYLVVYL